MGEIKTHLPVKFFCAVTFAPTIDLQPVLTVLEKTFSGIEKSSEPFDFSSFTEYYDDEMGKDLRKIFVVFTKLMPPESLVSAKIQTNSMEDRWLIDSKRSVNLDPGYVSDAKLVLATTKNYNHRLYLGKGIYGDIHLNYTNKSYQPQPWTYPDYAQPGVIEFFNIVRSNYFHQLGERLA